MALTNEDLSALSQLLDSKLQNFATKKDLEPFATKKDLEPFATKKDLEPFATKKDLDYKLRELENNILEEVDTVQEKTNDHFKRIEKRLDKIEGNVNASKLQNDTLNLLLRRIDLLQDEINDLKKKVS